MNHESHAPSWTFLTNHAHVLLCIATGRGDTLREVAAHVGITERAVQRIVSDLETAGVLRRSREGRRNRYLIEDRLPLRHPLEAHRTVRDLLALLEPGGPRRALEPEQPDPEDNPEQNAS